MNQSQKLAESGDFVSLPQDDEYRLYFQQIEHVFKTLENWCAMQAEGGSEESKILQLFLTRLLVSVKLLRERQRFRPDKNLKLDLNESGFPHYIGLEELNTDLRRAPERLQALPTMLELKEWALDSLFKNKAEPLNELALMAERRYYTLLKDADFMGPFRFSGVLPQGDAGRRRNYLCAWACYSAVDNLPYIHTMLFEQDKGERALERKGDAYEAFKDVISSEGSRRPPLAVLAAAIDDRLETIHPKILKRTRIGPLNLPRFTYDQGPLSLMVKGLGRPTEFSIEIVTETVFAEREVVKEKGTWLRPDKVRSIFAIPETDLECFEAKVSRIHKYLLLPHHLMQHMRDNDAEASKHFAEYEKVVYDAQLAVYSI